MRNAVLFSLLLLACGGAPPSEEYRILLAHVGVPLDASYGTELGAALETLGIYRPGRPPGIIDRILRWAGFTPTPASVVMPPVPDTCRRPKTIYPLPGDRIVVVSVPKLISIPGRPMIWLHVVDRNGRVTLTGPFSGGYRTGFPDISFRLSGRLGVPEVSACPTSATGGSFERLYCALQGDRFVLVRVEHMETMEIAKNHFGAPNFTVGPDVPVLDAAGWRERLASDDPVTLLSTLAWLGGVHLDVHRPSPDTWHEERKLAWVWDDMVTNEATIRRLKDLAGSKEPWIAEAARSALTIERYPRR